MRALGGAIKGAEVVIRRLLGSPDGSDALRGTVSAPRPHAAAAATMILLEINNRILEELLTVKIKNSLSG